MLKQQNLELKKINNTKNKLYSILTHDLKNPLSAVYSFSELLLRRKNKISEEKVEKYLKTINQGSEESLNLLENMTNWAIVQSKDIVVKKESLQTKELIQTVLDYLDASLKEKEITLHTFYDESLAINSDRNMLNTILRNLVSNAIKYSTRKSDIILKIEETPEDTKFSISDSGIGISQKEQKYLFDKSITFQTKGTEQENGTGLGLVICKEFIERLNGTIWVESDSGKGATFLFTIPI
jgi:signal transduction histidine kinase